MFGRRIGRRSVPGVGRCVLRRFVSLVASCQSSNRLEGCPFDGFNPTSDGWH